MKMEITRHIPLSLHKGAIVMQLEPYERQEIINDLNAGRKVFVAIQAPTNPVSSPMRKFFYGYAFRWVAYIYEKHCGMVIPAKNDFGKAVLKAIYDSEAQHYEIGGLYIYVPNKELSFGKKESTKRIAQAIDVWTLFFAENFGEQFPIPDKDWKVKI